MDKSQHQIGLTIEVHGEKRCNWCTCSVEGELDKYHNHCRRMLKRLKSRIRKGDNCFRCGHSLKEHLGKVTVEKVLVSTTLCCHVKRDWQKKGDIEPEHDDQCHCEVYL